jgi:DNA-binding GntR family transcriptional regulator
MKPLGAEALLHPRLLPASAGLELDGIASRIAEAIISGVYAPGAALNEVALATFHQVSRTPIREALRQLQATGLVEIRPRRGVVVASPSDKSLHDMFVVMADLEALCAGLSAVTMTARDAAQLDDLHQASAAAVRNDDRTAYMRMNQTFHEALYSGSGNAYLAELTRATHLRLAPFRKAQFQSPDRLAQSFAEHGQIVEAVLRGDKETASRAMREHIGTVERAYARLAI